MQEIIKKIFNRKAKKKRVMVLKPKEKNSWFGKLLAKLRKISLRFKTQ